jgi:integrase/recombinase XerD
MSKSTKKHATINEIESWVESFLIDRQTGNLSPNTIQFYRRDLNKFAAYCDAVGISTLESLRADSLRRFLLWLERKGHNPGGIHAHYRIVKVFLRWWADEIDARDYGNLFKKVKAPKVNNRPLPPVPLENVNALVKTCGKNWHGKRDRAVILALLDTGARAREFLALDLSNVDLRSGAVQIAKGKGSKARTVFIGKTTRRAVRRYIRIRNRGPLWTTQDGYRLTYSGLRGMLRRRAESAGVAFPTPHAFRRAFALNMLRAGTDLETLRRLMGHADLQVLRRYLDLLDSDLQRAHAIASPADQLRNSNKRR